MDGQIPTELGLCTALNSLVLSENKLSGSLPTELGRLTNLLELIVDRNFLSGTIAPEICAIRVAAFRYDHCPGPNLQCIDKGCRT